MVKITVLIDRLEQGEGRIVDQALHRELCDRAAVHVQVRDTLVLPALRRAGWKGLRHDDLVAHVMLKRTLAVLVISPPGSLRFDTTLPMFRRAVERQREVDQRAIVPALRAALDLAERRALCNEVELLHQSLLGPRAEPIEHDRSPAAALVEDASIVLASLAAASSGAADARQP